MLGRRCMLGSLVQQLKPYYPWISMILGPGVIAAIITGFFNRRNNKLAEQKRQEFERQLADEWKQYAAQLDRERRVNEARNFLSKSRARFESDTQLIAIRDALRKEAKAKKSGNLLPSLPGGMTAYDARNLPASLEPIGTYLEYHLPSTPELPPEFAALYSDFSEEVLLCADSTCLWEGDDYHRSSYWVLFRKFVESTRRWGLPPSNAAGADDEQSSGWHELHSSQS
jgi:hypothetical protein